MAINYEKYNNMDKRKLINALISVEKKEEKAKEEFYKKLIEIQELAMFLKAKIKESLNSPKNEFLTREQAGLDKIANEVRNQFSEQELEQLEMEVKQEINRNYNNEL